VQKDGIDLLSISAHKLYGPKGVGALYVRRKNPRVQLTAIIDGGGHERGLRDRLKNGIMGKLDETYINGSMEHRLPHNINISFAYVEGESLLMGINDVAVSSGSACTS